ncbi:putative transporter [Lachnellula hyalina]|uniref:Putative transporter n=1 Tax=Lachnellula hyalina TaxID=1316788 RepID=A0A8H8R2W1_9HELO|nr:putative transporter [Lachnellula hyalina]TVY27419.1 putative transporter [Lachnellula hyalina]
MSQSDEKGAGPNIHDSGGENIQISTTQAPKKKWWNIGGPDISFAAVDPAPASNSSSTSIKDDIETSGAQTVQGSVFDDSKAAELYQPVEKYEGRHRFDPSATWTEEEERKLIRSLDWRICLPACIMFFALQLDRGNLSQALSDNMLKDLKMNTNDYNNGMSIFYCSFLFAELPSQLVSKKIGPDNWIPIQMCLWSVVAICQVKITGRTSFYITRFLLGLCEGGFIPDVVLYLSYFYKNKELPVRLAFFWTSYVSTNIISAFLAYGILHLRGHGGMAGWRWLFAIEGGLTALIGVLSWFYLPPSPTQTKAAGLKGWFRGKKGWFTDHQEVIMVTRILRDDPGKATMHNRQAITPKLLWESLIDFDMWPIYLIGLTWTVPMTPPMNYLTLTLKSLGFSTFNTNLLVIPSSVLFMIQLLFWTWLSEKLNQRFLIGLVSQIWVIPLLIALEVLPAHVPHAQWVRYAISSLIVGYPYVHAILVAITSRNAGTVRTRTVGSSLYNMAVQTSNIISTQIYRDKDKPLYRTGNKVLLGIAAWNFCLFIGAKVYYFWKNKKRDQIWDTMDRDQKLHYLETTKDKGNKRLDFRFAH